VRSPSRSTRPWLTRLVASALVALATTGCVAGATQSEATPSPAATDSGAPAIAESPSLTPVAPPSESVAATGPTTTSVPTTQTDWGTILDAVPDTFPRYPDAKTSEPPSEPVSDALETTASVDDVATWYRDALGSAGFGAIDVSSPLEDGSRVLDGEANAPGCQVQLTFRPLGESTMIIVLYGAGCVGTSG